MTKIALNELHPNPFRDLKRLPVKPEKVEALMESIKETSFWDNIVCRKATNGSGGYEIAYGHNRLAALKKLHWSEVDIPVRVLDNDAMAKIMARENHEEWGAYAEVDAETVRSVIAAFGAGLIHLDPVAKNTAKARIAPDFTVVHVSLSEGMPSLEGMKKAYTNQTLAKYLGWVEPKAERILRVLDFKQSDKAAATISFDNLSSTQADLVIREIRRIRRDTEDDSLAKKIGNQLAVDFRTGNLGAKSMHSTRGRIVSTDTAHARSNELMRGHRIKSHIAKRKAKEIKLSIQREDRQVAIFLEACKTWEKAVEVADYSLSKFSPEAKRFVLRRLVLLGKVEALLRGKLK